MPTRRSIPRLSGARIEQLRTSLDALLDHTATQTSLEQDPLSLPREYADPIDIEIAAFLSSCLAFGRVAAFLPVVRSLLERAQDQGGPARWAMEFDRTQLDAIRTLQYRWVRGQDLALLVATLGVALKRHGRLGSLFEARLQPDAPHVGEVLETGLSELHEIAATESIRLGLPAGSHLRRGFICLLSRPRGGSACKRMCMLLRWMCRQPGPGAAGVDLGLWNLPPSLLLIPLDTHVLHVSQLIGLTRRSDGSWRTVLEITAALRKICPEDPIRYDFALAHLGISGTCKRRYVDTICNACPLLSVCRHGGPSRRQTLGQLPRHVEV